MSQINASTNNERRNSELVEAFALELRSQRNQAGLSQEAFAHLANVHRSYIARLESAKYQPTLSVLNDLAEALNNKFPNFINDVFVRYRKTLAQRRAESKLK